MEYFTISFRKDGSGGEGIYKDVKFRFYIYDCKKHGYNKKLIITLISPGTQKILQSTKKQKKLESAGKITAEDNEKLKKGQSLEKLNAEASAYLKKKEAQNKQIVRQVVEKKVEKLFADNQDDLFKDLSISKDVRNLHTRTIFEMYQNDFFAHLALVNKNTLRAKKKRLEGACNHLNHVPMGEITARDVKCAADKLPKSKRDETINLLDEFFRYCGEIGVYPGVNPVAEYKSSQKKKSTDRSKTGSLYTEYSTCLDVTIEKILHDMISKDLDNDLSLAVPLVKGFRMPMRRLLELTWADIQIDEDGVRISDYHDTYTGGTYNYTRPPLRETADFIKIKFGALCERCSLSTLRKRHVIDMGDIPEKKRQAVLTKYIRDTLLEAGVSVADLQQVAMQSTDPKAPGGSGHKLLCQHYDHVLQTRCGVNLDSGLGHFLRGIRIYDTTNDFYRSLRDATGNDILQEIMARDNLFVSVDKSQHYELTSRTLENGREITAPPAPPGARTAISTKKHILVPKGSLIVIRGPVEGIVRSRVSPTNTAADNTITLY